MKVTIGRSDKADFPEFSLSEIDLKIDSGAYTSSIHCSKIKETSLNGKPIIRFTLLDPEHSFYNNKEFTSKNYASKIINETFPIYLTLSERKDMKFPILLGRKFLNKKFVIDTTKKNLSHKLKNTL
jgi:hypothetical protein